MTKRKSLGRGLDALLSQRSPEGSTSDAPDRQASCRSIYLPAAAIQPRVDFREESLAELAESIRAQGILQPIVVRPLPGGDGGETRYEIVAGERRWRAAQLAGLDSVPALIRDVPDEAAVAISLIENIQRENLNPIEEADALKRLGRGVRHDS